MEAKTPSNYVVPRATPEAAKKWFDETTVVDGPFRNLLETYSHIPPDQVVDHVVKVVGFAYLEVFVLERHD
jgi:hypothetical protein